MRKRLKKFSYSTDSHATLNETFITHNSPRPPSKHLKPLPPARHLSIDGHSGNEHVAIGEGAQHLFLQWEHLIHTIRPIGAPF
nr:hypothetical protein [Candidatus Freyrarchaeum guaymaensis]